VDEGVAVGEGKLFTILSVHTPQPEGGPHYEIFVSLDHLSSGE